MSYYSQSSSSEREEQFRQSSQQRRFQQQQRQSDRARDARRQRQAAAEQKRKQQEQALDEQTRRARQLQQYQQQVRAQQYQQYQQQLQAQQAQALAQQQAQAQAQALAQQQAQTRAQTLAQQQAEAQAQALAQQQAEAQAQALARQQAEAQAQAEKQAQILRARQRRQAGQPRTQAQQVPQQAQYQQQLQQQAQYQQQVPQVPQQPQQRRTSQKSGNPAQRKHAGSGRSSSRTETKGGISGAPGRFLQIYRSQKWTISELWLFPAVFLILEAFLRLFGGTGLFSHFIYPLLFNLSAGFLLSAIGVLIPKKWRRVYNIVLLFLIGLVYLVACMVHDNYQMYMSPASIFAGAHNVTSQYSGELLLAIFKGIPKIILFFLPGILYTVTGKRRVPLRRYQPVFAGVLAAAAVVLFGVGAFAGSHGATATTYSGVQNFNNSTETFGLLTSIRLSMGSDSSSTDFVIDDTETTEPETVTLQESAEEEASVEEEPIVYGPSEMDLDLDSLINSDDEEISSISTYVSSLTPSSENAYTGLFEGKNLILICAEAFSDKCVSEELTPTLYRLIHNGIYMSEFYQPAWGGSTSTGEFSTLMGIAPTRGVESVEDTANCNNYFTMGNQLQRLGYYSAAFHSGGYQVYDRDLTHENFGYSVWCANGNGLEDLIDGDTSDTVLFETTLDACMDQQPFSLYYMTLSGHCTYLKDSRFVTEYYDEVKAYYGDQYSDTVLYYICYQMELENALTVMIQKLEDAGIADDTVICMCADHYPYGLQEADAFQTDQDYLLELYGSDYDDHPWGRDRNSAVIWSECLENEYKDMACEVKAPTYSLDLLPTLSNLFGVEWDSRLLVGRDILSDAEPIVLWNNYCWATEYGKYDYQEGKFYPNAGYESYADNQDYIDRIQQIVVNKLNYSDAVLVNDYFGVLFGEDDEVGNVMTIEPKTEDTSQTETAEAADTAADAAADGTEEAAASEAAAAGTAEDGTADAGAEENTT